VVILEAMSSGLAIVASDIPEIAQGQIEHGVEGLLTPVGDVDQLASALAALIESAALRQSLGQAARERVMPEFTLEAVERQYLRLYGSLCG
jgi:glycosyltransferase involved in cell wall biosynthesis